MRTEIFRMLERVSSVAPTAYLQLQTFDLGGVSLDVTVAGRSFEFACGPLSGIGVSETHEDTLPFTQHDRYFETIEQAADHLVALIVDAQRHASPPVAAAA